MKYSNFIIYTFGIMLLLLLANCKKDKKTPGLSTMPVSEITATDAVGGGEIINDEGQGILSRGLVWSAEKSATLQNNLGFSESKSEDYLFTSEIFDLSSGQLYYVRAFATNSDGTGYGEDMEFVTIETNGGSPYGGTPCPGMASIIDTRDQRTYTTVKIGSQCWLQQNLLYLPELHTPNNLSNISARYYVFGLYDLQNQEDFISSLYLAYGALYNFTAAQSACPDGWHLPSSNEWKNLTTYLGENPGGKLKSTLTQPYPHPRWTALNVDASNETGFRGLPGGKQINEDFSGQGNSGVWWSATPANDTEGLYFLLQNSSGMATINNYPNESGFSVRCIRDGDVSVPTVNTLNVSNISAFTALIEGEIVSSGGASITESGVAWSTNPYPTVSDNLKTSEGNQIHFSVEINNLDEITTYYARAYAVNSAGISYGYQLIFTTDDNNYPPCPGLPSFTDSRDGNTYETVLIGNQCWMRQNLAWLPAVHKPENGSSSGTRYYVYGYDSTILQEAINRANYINYGTLYNWPAALSACPQGWHLPENDEWQILTYYLGGEEVAGGKMKSKHTVPDQHPRWIMPNAEASDQSFFSGYPGGFRIHFGYFKDIGSLCQWWSSDVVLQNSAWIRILSSENGIAEKAYASKENGLSIRCIKNDF